MGKLIHAIDSNNQKFFADVDIILSDNDLASKKAVSRV